MPELPEVETMVRGIRGHVEGRSLLAFERCVCDYRPIRVTPEDHEFSVSGRTVAEVRRFAKRVVLHLDDGSAFAVEPRMTGLMLIADPPDRDHLRVRWRLEGAGPLWFWDRRGLGTVSFYGPGEFERAMATRYGPDALTMTPTLWRKALAKTSRPVKVAMLDQSLVAGIGNMYASEILHLAGIDPRTPSSRIGLKRSARIDDATHEILREAIRNEGSTLSDGTYRNALNQDGTYQNAHQVYDRAGNPCFRCGGTIRRVVQAQRSTFFCGRCQKR